LSLRFDSAAKLADSLARVQQVDCGHAKEAAAALADDLGDSLVGRDSAARTATRREHRLFHVAWRP
jgi:hypothetical protein